MVVNRTLKDSVIVVTGASRGIGRAIAKRAARDGAKIAILAKTTEPHPTLEGTIYTAAEEIKQVGGDALPIVCDIRSEDDVQKAIDQVITKWGRIDVLVNNASAISLSDTETTSMKRYDLMNQVNGRGTFLCSKYCIPHLKRSSNAHILNISPPLDMDVKWFQPHTAYTIAKYVMSMCTLGMSGELLLDHIAVNSLWPRTTIATAAVNNLLGGEDIMRLSRDTEIMADAAYEIITSDSSSEHNTGNFYLDDEVLADKGLPNYEKYSITPGSEHTLDFFIHPNDTRQDRRERLTQITAKQEEERLRPDLAKVLFQSRM